MGWIKIPLIDVILKDETIWLTQKIRVTASDGKKCLTGFYNLDAIIAVGYRVNSKKATKFRIWATDVLKGYITTSIDYDKDFEEAYTFFKIVQITLCNSWQDCC